MPLNRHRHDRTPDPYSRAVFWVLAMLLVLALGARLINDDRTMQPVAPYVDVTPEQWGHLAGEYVCRWEPHDGKRDIR